MISNSFSLSGSGSKGAWGLTKCSILHQQRRVLCRRPVCSSTPSPRRARRTPPTARSSSRRSTTRARVTSPAAKTPWGDTRGSVCKLFFSTLTLSLSVLWFSSTPWKDKRIQLLLLINNSYKALFSNQSLQLLLLINNSYKVLFSNQSLQLLLIINLSYKVLFSNQSLQLLLIINLFYKVLFSNQS